MLKLLLRKIIRFCKDTLLFIRFLMRLCIAVIQGNMTLSNPIKKKYTGTATILANGPSLKEVIPLLTTDDAFKNTDFIVMNFFAIDDVFFKIKPKHYCFIDAKFYMKGIEIDEVRKLFAIMQEKVNWPLNIYVYKSLFPNFQKFSGFTNKYINIIEINNEFYEGYSICRHFFYAKGLSIPPMNSVAIMAIFVSINSGYSNIKLYGVDHNFFDTLSINSDNVLCASPNHFYDKNPVPAPIAHPMFTKVRKISEELKATTGIFIGHDILSEYAEAMNVNILNCTKNSLIDSYRRVPLETHYDLSEKSLASLKNKGEINA
jgi:hypothetical protein